MWGEWRLKRHLGSCEGFGVMLCFVLSLEQVDGALYWRLSGYDCCSEIASVCLLY
jgi:hypothetical protein